MTEPGLVALEARRDRIHLRMTALRLGGDLAVTLAGGDRPHVGAVALAAPGAPASALSLPKHREAELAQHIASALAAEFGTGVSVTCGIHLDGILPTEIAEVLEMAEGLTRELTRKLEEG
jgi:hypothetical protein